MHLLLGEWHLAFGAVEQGPRELGRREALQGAAGRGGVPLSAQNPGSSGRPPHLCAEEVAAGPGQDRVVRVPGAELAVGAVAPLVLEVAKEIHLGPGDLAGGLLVLGRLHQPVHQEHALGLALELPDLCVLAQVVRNGLLDRVPQVLEPLDDLGAEGDGQRRPIAALFGREQLDCVKDALLVDEGLALGCQVARVPVKRVDRGLAIHGASAAVVSTDVAGTVGA